MIDISHIVPPTDFGTASSAEHTHLRKTRINQEAIKRWIAVDREAFDNGLTITSSENRALTTVAGSAPPADLGVVKLPETPRVVPREEILQEWEGQVQDVGAQYFSARLVDMTLNEKEETEEADLPIDDLVEGDRTLLVPGAVFRWIIGYRWANGEKERFTRVVIRRLPAWTEREIKSADREATELHNALFGHEGKGATFTGSN